MFYHITLLLILFYFLGESQDIECYNYKECANEALSPNTYGDDIYCRGYYACEEATITSNYFVYVYCDGCYGCYKSNINLGEGRLYCGSSGCLSAEITSGQVVSCEGDNSCYSTTITAKESVECNGDTSCYAALIEADIQIQCGGSFSCQTARLKSPIIECSGLLSCPVAHIDVPNAFVTCNGYQGCANIFVDAARTMWCNGFQGCAVATAYLKRNLYCDGDQACNADIYLDSDESHMISVAGNYGAYYADMVFLDNTVGVQYIFSEGYRGLYHTDIHSGQNNTLYVYFYGYESGTFTKLHCEEGSACYIYCYGYACNSSTVIYHRESATIQVECYTAPDESYCPTERELNGEIEENSTMRKSQRDEWKKIHLATIGNTTVSNHDDIDYARLLEHNNIDKNMTQQEIEHYQNFKRNKIEEEQQRIEMLPMDDQKPKNNKPLSSK